MTKPQMHSLFAHCQIDGDLLLSTHSNLSAACLKWVSYNNNFVCWKMRHNTWSKNYFSVNSSMTDVFHHKNIGQMMWKEQCKLSKVMSSKVYAQQDQTSLWKYLTNSYLWLKIPSTWYVLHVMTHPNQHMKSSIESATSMTNHGHHQIAKQFYQTYAIPYIVVLKRNQCLVKWTNKSSLVMLPYAYHGHQVVSNLQRHHILSKLLQQENHPNTPKH